MRIASRKGRRARTAARAPRRRVPRRMPDRGRGDSDKRLFIQLCVSAALVVAAVVVGTFGGGLRDSFVAVLERSADLSDLNEVISGAAKSIPVISQLFDESATPVFKGLLGEPEGGTELLPAGEGGYTTYVVSPQQDYPVAAQGDEVFVSGFDESAYDALPDISEDDGGGGAGQATASVVAHGEPFPVSLLSLVAEDTAPEETPDGREVPDNATLQKIELGITLTTPVAGEISSAFGSRGDAVESEFHHGLDIAAGYGKMICAVAAGRVTEVASNGVYGKYLVIEHEGGLVSKYAHCSRVTVKEGERVKAGQKVAAVGSTGQSTGPHLHLELRKDGIFVDPALYIEVGES